MRHGVVILKRTPERIRDAILNIYQKTELYCPRFHPGNYRNVAEGTYLELGTAKVASKFMNSEAMRPYRHFVDYF